MDVYTVRVIREDDWWAADITGPHLELSGGGTATESPAFASLEDEVRDIIALMSNRDARMPYEVAIKDFDIQWDFSSLPAEVSEPLTEFLSLKAERSALEKRYLAIERVAALGLANVVHASHRDTAAFMGLSHSRVAQVLRGHTPARERTRTRARRRIAS